MVPASNASPGKKERGKAITNADDAAMLMNKYAMHDYTTDSMPVVPVYVPGTLAQFRASHPHLARTAGKIKLLWRWVYAWGHERFTSAFCVWNQHGFGAWPYGHPMGNKVAASLRLFSTKDNAWVAGIRKEAEQSYVELNRAVASKNTKTLETYAVGEYAKLVQDRAQRSPRSEWSLVKHIRPVKLVSYRSLPFQEDSASVRGNGWVFQAVFRFDTIQSLRIVPSARELAERHQNARKIVNGKVVVQKVEQDKPTEHHIIEHLVLERRGWLPNRPWTVTAAVKPGSHVGSHQLAEELGLLKDWEVFDPATSTSRTADPKLVDPLEEFRRALRADPEGAKKKAAAGGKR